jgi:hypothetical protein
MRSAVRQSLPTNVGAAGEPPLPIHPVTLSSLLYGILPFGPPYAFRQATERAVDSAADLRWGPDRKGFRRLVHPNGICLTGLWQITEDTGYPCSMSFLWRCCARLISASFSKRCAIPS